MCVYNCIYIVYITGIYIYIFIYLMYTYIYTYICIWYYNIYIYICACIQNSYILRDWVDRSSGQNWVCHCCGQVWPRHAQQPSQLLLWEVTPVKAELWAWRRIDKSKKDAAAAHRTLEKGSCLDWGKTLHCLCCLTVWFASSRSQDQRTIGRCQLTSTSRLEDRFQIVFI